KTGTGCIIVSSSWKPSGRFPRMFSSRLTLQNDDFSKPMNKKCANSRWRIKSAKPSPDVLRSTVENRESAARKFRRDITTAKSDRGIGVVHGIRTEARRIIVRINRSGSELVGADWTVRGEGTGHDLIDANTRPPKRPANAVNKAGWGGRRPFKDSRLL